MHSIWLPTAPASDHKAMRDFSRGFSLFLCIFFLGLIPWLFDHPISLWPLIVSAVLLAGGQFYPPSVYPVYRVWMVVASLLAWLNTRLIMLFAFYCLIFPIGIVLRLLNKLQYQNITWSPGKKAINNTKQSYWVKRENSPAKDNLKEPF